MENEWYLNEFHSGRYAGDLEVNRDTVVVGSGPNAVERSGAWVGCFVYDPVREIDPLRVYKAKLEDCDVDF